jgi:hypothetical protein
MKRKGPKTVPQTRVHLDLTNEGAEDGPEDACSGSDGVQELPVRVRQAVAACTSPYRMHCPFQGHQGPYFEVPYEPR